MKVNHSYLQIDYVAPCTLHSTFVELEPKLAPQLLDLEIYWLHSLH